MLEHKNRKPNVTKIKRVEATGFTLAGSITEVGLAETFGVAGPH